MREKESGANSATRSYLLLAVLPFPLINADLAAAARAGFAVGFATGAAAAAGVAVGVAVGDAAGEIVGVGAVAFGAVAGDSTNGHKFSPALVTPMMP